MKLFQRKRGSITVFLSIVLVPILLFTSILVDSAAYALSKGMVESAGELAANGALANYDTVIKDVYGLFAMSQSADDPQQALKENVQAYFQNSLKANGLIDAASWDSDTMQWINQVLDDAMGIDDAAITPFVNVSLEDSSEFTYLEDSSLANPDVLRSQIVEYAKYRAPVNAALSSLDTLGAFKKVEGQSEVMKAKTAVDETLEDTNRELKKMYENIGKYDDQVAEFQKALDKAAADEFSFDDVEGAMRLCHSILFNVEAPGFLTCRSINAGEYECAYDGVIYIDGNGELFQVANGQRKSISASSWGRNKKLDEIEEHFGEAEESAKTIEAGTLQKHKNKVAQYGAYSEMTMENPWNTASGTNPKRLEAAIGEYEAFGEKLREMKSCILAIDQAAMEPYEYPDSVYDTSDIDPADYETEEAYNEAVQSQIASQKSGYDNEKKEEFEGAKDALRESLTGGIKAFSDTSAKYASAVETYENNYKKYDRLLRETLCKLNNLLCPVAESASELTDGWHFSFNWLDSHSGTLAENAIDSINDVQAQMEKLQEATEAAEWEISKYQDNYLESAGQDEFSASMQASIEEIANQFNTEDLKEITEQIQAGINYMSSEGNPVGVLKAIESIKLSGVSLVKESYYKVMTVDKTERLLEQLTKAYRGSGTLNAYSAADPEISYLGREAAAFDTAYENQFAQSVLFNVCSDPGNLYNKYNTTSTCYLKKVGEKGVTTADGNLYNIPAFYFYLITVFSASADVDPSQPTEDSIKDFQEQAQDSAEEDNVNSTTFSYDMGLFTEVPSDGTSGEGAIGKEDDGGLFDFFNNAASTFQEIFQALGNLNPENAVDSLLVTEYVLNDFSSYMDWVAYTEGTDNFPEGSKDYPRQTYSNMEINAENNAMFGCEIEYILYGSKGQNETKFLWFTVKEGAGPEINVNQAKANIFAIRLMFNMVYALTDSEIDYQTLPPAMSIQAATGGMFPYQVAQTVMKLCLALAESNYDLERIMDGKKVELVKSDETWKFSLGGMVDLAKDYVAEEVKNVGEEIVTEINTSIQEALDYTTENVNDIVQGMRDNMISVVDNAVNGSVDAVTQCFNTSLEMYYQEMLTKGTEYSRQELLNRCEESVSAYLAESGMEGAAAELLKNDLMGQLRGMLADGGSIDLHFEALEEELRRIDLDKEALAQNYTDFMRQVSKSTEEAIVAVGEEIRATVLSVAGEIAADLQGTVSEALGSQVDNATEKISEAINSKLDAYFPSSSIGNQAKGVGKTSSSALSSAFNMGYEDYLRVFLIIKLLSDESDMAITRIGDVIQINVNEGLNAYEVEHPKKGSFRMAEANTYLEINARIQVKPLLISQDWFEGWLGENMEYLSYDYHTIAGY